MATRCVGSSVHEVFASPAWEATPPVSAAMRLPDELEPVAAGNGADRQRYVFELGGMDGLVRWLVGRTESA